MLKPLDLGTWCILRMASGDTLRLAKKDVPIEAVEWFTSEARRRLPAVTPGPDARGSSP